VSGEDSIRLKLGNFPNVNKKNISAIISNYGETFESLTLDEILSTLESSVVIKMDCEGSEFPIILNTRPSSFDKIEKMSLEYHNNYYEGLTSDILMRALKKQFEHVKRIREGRMIKCWR
jgi:hypothetical protein